MFDLEPGTVLNGRYTIERYIEYNGSMLLYSAEDSKTLARVLLWEFYPCDSAFRKDGGRDIVFYWKERDGRIPDDIKRHCLAMTGSSGNISRRSVIPAVTDIFEENNTFYIVTEYPPGVPLVELCEKGGKCSEPEYIVKLFIPFLNEINELNKKGVFLLRITPDMPILTPDGRLMIIYDRCKVIYDSIIRDDDSGSFPVGTGFEAIELFQSEGNYKLGDIYSAAAALYYFLTGKKPQPALDRIFSDETPPPSEAAADKRFSAQLDAVIMKGMAVQPKERFRSASEFADALQKLLDSGKIMDPDCELPPEETPGDKKEPPVPVPGPTPAADDPAKKSGSSDKTHKTYADPKEFSFVKNVLILGLAVLLFQVVCIFLSSLFRL